MNDRPFIGDIRIDRDKYPVGTPLNKIVDFDVWDGKKWVPADEASKPLKVMKNNGR